MLKNNNPGNIRSFVKDGKYSTPFIGETLPPDIKPGKTAGFRIFTTLPYGYRALFKVLKTGYLDKGLNTINKIFPIYAPASDNNTPSAYISSVESMSGINRNTILKSYFELIPIVKAITKVETGTTANDWAIIDGYNIINDTIGPTQQTPAPELPQPTNKIIDFIKDNKKKILISAAILTILLIYYENQRTKLN